MTDIITVKKAILDILKADSTLQNLLGKDKYGNIPIYHSFIQHRIHKPCITIEDVSDQGEVSSLNDAYDGTYRFEWHFAIIQIDCWSSNGPEERDQIQKAVQKCLLNDSNQQALRSNGIIYLQEPSIRALDEMDVKPPLWRKSLRYRVFYILDS